MKGRVLIIDDEKNVGFVIEAMLARAGYETLCFQNSHEAMRVIEEEDLDAVVTDLFMPGADGMAILAKVQETQPQLPVVMITAFGTIESAVEALKKGAFDFITKPFEQSDLLASVAKAVASSRESQKEPVPLFLNRSPSLVIDPVRIASPLIGDSPVMEQLRRTVDRIAPLSFPILIEGEIGTGKDRVAEEIHQRSDRSRHPFIKMPCGAIPAEIVLQEIFGGGVAGQVLKPGRLELAEGGTLFLDEVLELPVAAQTQLLQFLENGVYFRVGSNEARRGSVRIVASTGKRVDEAVKQGRFQEALYLCFQAYSLRVPALRERPEDIDSLVRESLSRMAVKHRRSLLKIEPDCLQVLERYEWPGNLRQLDNVIERLVLTGEDQTVRASDLPPELQEVARVYQGSHPVSFKERVRLETRNVERDLIVKALDEEQGNVTRTAEKLGLSRKGLQLKMKELGIRR